MVMCGLCDGHVMRVCRVLAGSMEQCWWLSGWWTCEVLYGM